MVKSVKSTIGASHYFGCHASSSSSSWIGMLPHCPTPWHNSFLFPPSQIIYGLNKSITHEVLPRSDVDGALWHTFTQHSGLEMSGEHRTRKRPSDAY